MSRQFYCLLGRKPGELRKPSSRKYRCLLTVVYARHKPGELRKPSSRKYRCLLTVVYAKWGRNLENYESHHPENTGVYQQLSTQNTSDPLAGHF
ncbi:unnamed protein product [Schistosoma mattheei]|uniref:Uncharacterized protein n=1 Tax=Schistosoma mattheei TaxID=31246 RepID=A0A183Q634_9TREM|nr:unnamed protein product [Schistosoma mattheei]